MNNSHLLRVARAFERLLVSFPIKPLSAPVCRSLRMTAPMYPFSKGEIRHGMFRWLHTFLLVTGGLMVGTAAHGEQQVSVQPWVTGQPILQSQSSTTPVPIQVARIGDRVKGAAGKVKGAVENVKDAAQAPCGGESQRPCVTGCDRGFILNATGDKNCHACGAENQPACLPGGCNSGLSASRDGMCRAECGAENQPACLVGGCDRGFILSATGDRKCHACGAENQSPCLTGGCGDGFILNAIGDMKCHACGGENQQPCGLGARLGGGINDLTSCSAPADNKGCPFKGPGGNVELFSRCMGPGGALTKSPTPVGNTACEAVLGIQELATKLDGARDKVRARIDDRIDKMTDRVMSPKFVQTLAELKEVSDDIKQDFVAFSKDPECGRKDVYDGFKAFFGDLRASTGALPEIPNKRADATLEAARAIEYENKVEPTSNFLTEPPQQNRVSGWIATIAEDYRESVQIIPTADVAPTVGTASDVVAVQGNWNCGGTGKLPCANGKCKSGLVVNGGGLCGEAPCGGAGEAACGTGACNGILVYDETTGKCNASVCGGLNQTVCTTVPICNSRLVEDAAVCGPIALNPLYRSLKICSIGGAVTGLGLISAGIGLGTSVAAGAGVPLAVAGGVVAVLALPVSAAGCLDSRGMWRTDKDKYKFAYSERRKLDRSGRKAARKAERQEGRQARLGFGDTGKDSAAADGDASLQTREDPDVTRFGENVDLLLTCTGKIENLTKSLRGDVGEGAQELKAVLVDVEALEETIANIKQAGADARQAAHDRAEARRNVFRAAASTLYQELLGVPYGQPARADTTGPQLLRQVKNNQVNNLKGRLAELKSGVDNMADDAVGDLTTSLGGLEQKVTEARERAETILPRLESGLKKLRQYKSNKAVAGR